MNAGLWMKSPINLNFHMLHVHMQQPPPPESRTVPFSPEVGGVLALTLMLSDFCAACRELLYWGKITATPPQREVGGTLCTDAPHLGRPVYCCSHVLMPSLQFWCLCMTDIEAARLLFAPLLVLLWQRPISAFQKLPCSQTNHN